MAMRVLSCGLPRGTELHPAFARSGERRHHAACEIDAPNRVIFGVGHEDRVARRDNALRMVEAGLVGCAIEQARLAAAIAREILATIIEQDDLIMPAVGKHPSLPDPGPASAFPETGNDPLVPAAA